MSYFAYHPTTRPTGRNIARKLGFRNFGTLLRRGQQVDPLQGLLIRWGISRFGYLDGQNGVSVVNSARAIWKAGDKLASISCLQEAGIKTPAFRRETPPQGDADVWLGRLRRGFGGRDISLAGQDSYSRAEFYTKFIPNDREYRIHVVCGEVIRVQRKYLEYPEKRQSDYIKNHGNGYVFATPSRKLNRSRLDAAVRAVQALGLDFGAVDLVVDHEGLEYVLEVNTAPACSPLTLSDYTKAFRRHFPQIAENSV